MRCGQRFEDEEGLKLHRALNPRGYCLHECLEEGCDFSCHNYREYRDHHTERHVWFMDEEMSFLRLDIQAGNEPMPLEIAQKWAALLDKNFKNQTF